MNWVSLKDQLPPEHVVVWTKIDESGSVRNESKLIRKGNLFFHKDMSMYVYYRPTHWAYIN